MSIMIIIYSGGLWRTGRETAIIRIRNTIGSVAILSIFNYHLIVDLVQI